MTYPKIDMKDVVDAFINKTTIEQMSDFVTERLGVPYEAPKRVRIIARSCREAEDYKRTLPNEQAMSARYVGRPSEIFGTRDCEFHLIGRYWENSNWREMEYVLKDRVGLAGVTSKEVWDWR